MEAIRDGRIEDAQIARLDQILAEHPQMMEQFVDRAWLGADLELKLGRLPALGPSSGEGFRLPRRRAAGRWALVAAAAGLLVGIGAAVVLWGMSRTPDPGDRGLPDLSYEGCAVLARALDAQWEGSRPVPAVGAALPRRRLALVSGFIQVEFFSGARVVLEGPADFELVSSNEAFCRRGKLRAFVPPQAEGFKIRTSQMSVIDRGTEFGLRVDADGQAEVHVFQGRIELLAPGAPARLAVGEAVHLSAQGVSNAILADPEAFLGLSELSLRSQEEAKHRFARWENASGLLRQDPRVVLYYSFEDDQTWSGELRSQKGDHSPQNGAIVGCRWTEGRWPGKKALEWKRPGDRVRFRDVGEYESLTLMAWVRVDALDRPFSGLMLTDGWTSGSVHWQITQRGAVRLGIHGEGQAMDYDSPVLFEPALLGRWVHLCTVYDRTAREVAHYVDGRPVRRIPLRFDTALRLGSAELGNWGVPIYGNLYAVRNLNGRMDEFVLFGRALGADQVQALYAVGAPTS
jgi:hypothetical protein